MEDFNFCTLALTLFSLLYAWFFIRRLTTGGGGTSPPSPPSLPIIGNLHQLGQLPHRSLSNLSLKHGPLMLLHLGPKPVLVVSSAEVGNRILKSHYLDVSDKPLTRDLKKIFYNGNDLFNMPYGDRWRKLRCIVVHELLNRSRVKSFGSIREEETSILMRKIEELSTASQPVNLTRMLAAYSNDLISRATLGKTYSETEDGEMFLEGLEEGSRLLGSLRIGDYVPWLSWINSLNGRDAVIDRLVEKRDAFLDEVIQEHLQSSNASKENIMGILVGIYKGDIPGVSIDLVSIKAVILDIFAAGTETTTTTLIWLMTELLRHPTVMKKLQDEIQDTVKGKHHITDDELLKMPYLKAVIKETFRFHPPLPIFICVTRDHINLMGFEVAPKTMVLINAWAIGRDHAYWDEPEEFMPERFLNSSRDFIGLDFHLTPFGFGRRICPGLGFATAVVEHTVSNLMLRFDWALPDGEEGGDLDVTEQLGLTTVKDTPLLVFASIKYN